MRQNTRMSLFDEGCPCRTCSAAVVWMHMAAPQGVSLSFSVDDLQVVNDNIMILLIKYNLSCLIFVTEQGDA